MPLVQRHIARRAASLSPIDDGLTALVGLLNRAEADGLRGELLAGIEHGLEGRRTATMPAGWSPAFEKLQQSRDEAVRDSSIRLALVFDDVSALQTLRAQAADVNLATASRKRAIQSLVAKKDAELPAILLQLVNDPHTRGAALRGLAEFDHPQTVAVILEHYSDFNATARQDAISTLASRTDWAMRLLDELESERIPRTDLNAFTVRQLQSLGEQQIVFRLQSVWGQIRATPADKAQLISQYKNQLTPQTLAQADLPAGREVFQQNCATCHRLFDAGKTIGPDITGSQRTNLDYVLENLIDPSAAVARDYRMQIVVTTSGRIITGQVIAESEQALTIQTANDRLVVPADEIEDRKESPVSMMPEGLLQKLSADQVRDLVAYLASPTQVELLDSE
jgi:putative heme-binding domain-containing protein